MVTHSRNAAGQTAIEVSHERLSAQALLDELSKPPSIFVLIGPGKAPAPRHPGLTLKVVQDRLNLDPWLTLMDEQGGGGLRIHAVTLTANELILYDRRFTGMQVSARPDGAGWQLKVAGHELQGDVTWQPGHKHPILQG